MKITELKQVPKSKRGKFLRNGVKLESHEEKTAKFLTLYGFTVDVIRPVNTPGVRNPDFLINGIIWEAKSPEGKSKNTIERKFHEAGGQAKNFIMDLRRIKRPATIAEKEVAREFLKAKGIKRMLIITKNKKLLDYKK